MTTQELYQYIGRRVRQLRLQKEWTQDELSRRVEISLSFLGHIERGTRKLSVDTLYKLMLALECSADTLMGTEAHFYSEPASLLISELEKLTDHLRIKNNIP